MARRDFRRGAVAIRTSRVTTWFEFKPVSVTMSAADTAGVVFTLNVAALALRPFTIVRTRFMIDLRSDQAAAIEE